MKAKLLDAINNNELTSILIDDTFARRIATKMVKDLTENPDEINFASDLACNVLETDMRKLVAWTESNSIRRELYDSCLYYSDDRERTQEAQLIELETIASELLELAQEL